MCRLIIFIFQNLIWFLTVYKQLIIVALNIQKGVKNIKNDFFKNYNRKSNVTKIVFPIQKQYTNLLKILVLTNVIGTKLVLST